MKTTDPKPSIDIQSSIVEIWLNDSFNEERKMLECFRLGVVQGMTKAADLIPTSYDSAIVSGQMLIVKGAIIESRDELQNRKRK